MSRAGSIESIGRAIVEETRRIIDYHNARVYLLGPPDVVVPIAFEGRVGAYERVDPRSCASGSGRGSPAGSPSTGCRCASTTRSPTARTKTIQGTDSVPESMLVVPMRLDGDPVGVVTLSKLGLRQFDDEDLHLLQALADQAATALAGARLLAQTRELAQELRQLLDLSTALTQSLDPRAIANLIATTSSPPLGATQATVSDWERTGHRLRTLGAPRWNGSRPSSRSTRSPATR